MAGRGREAVSGLMTKVDDKLALGETGHLVVDVARSHRGKLGELDERYHLKEKALFGLHVR